jgi:hypothetical protein
MDSKAWEQIGSEAAQLVERKSGSWDHSKWIRWKAVQFVQQNRGSWDHPKWLEFIENIRRSYPDVDEKQLGQLLEDQKCQYLTTAWTETRSKAVQFVEENRGSWDHPKWLEFRKRYPGIDEKQLGQLLEDQKRQYLTRWTEIPSAAVQFVAQNCDAKWLEFCKRIFFVSQNCDAKWLEFCKRYPDVDEKQLKQLLEDQKRQYRKSFGRPGFVTICWAVLALGVILLLGYLLTYRNLLDLDRFGVAPWTQVAIYTVGLAILSTPTFLLISAIFVKANKDLAFVSKTAEETGEYKFKEFARTIPEYPAYQAVNQAYQRFRVFAYWYTTTSCIVLGAILLTLGAGITLYATADKAAEKNLSEWWGPVASRAGVVILVLFLVQILVPLYQYLLRLSAASTARADAIWLAVEKTTDGKLYPDDVQKMVNVLTLENMAFGKAPPTPAKDVVELLKEAKKSVH